MDNRVASKIVLLKIWEILNQETDEDNPMPSTVLLKKLDDMEIPCDRRTLYKYIPRLESSLERMCFGGLRRIYIVQRVLL